ncbi:unnamed protein product [Euphydryas editha]|uniref:Peptidoglycan recognition protein family domain-containing protein n=1 Tax=Euphydryas editha TaxID=104508 RepID=A0AAU9V167_EUPED|nr:unnamed protein product [Euphydryas editha]
MSSYGNEYLDLLVKNVIISLDIQPPIFAIVEICTKQMKIIQQFHFRNGWSDFAPNFFVGGNGDVFEGRGTNIFGVMVRGRFLGLELESSKQARRLRCSVAVFVCWAFIIATGLIVYIIYVTLPRQMRLDIGLNKTWYLRRVDWHAMASYGNEYLDLPVENVIIGHSATTYCNQKYHCIQQMMSIQQDHLRRGFDDIAPNFFIGGTGDVFEGRGANVLGAMVKGYNRISITIMFLGNYLVDQTNQLQLNHTQILIDRLVEIGALRSDYVLRGQCQVKPQTIPPGPNVMDKLNFFPHWNPEGKKSCLRR